MYIIAQPLLRILSSSLENIKFVVFNGTGVEFIKFFSFLFEFVINPLTFY